MTEPTLDTCGCCAGVEPLTPESRVNPPGQRSLSYRVGTHASFKQTMMAQLVTQIAKLTTRENDDGAIALLDAGATMLDVLTFYQERIANEGYLGTATERLSVRELARAIGYELNPGVAATTFLAFSLESAPGAPLTATINPGTRVQSLPRQDETPQTFETIETIQTRAKWNQLKPRLTEPRIPGFGAKSIRLKGITTGLKSGDGILLIGAERERDPGNEQWDFRLVKTVTTVPEQNYTEITWEKGLGGRRGGWQVLPAQENFQVYALRQRAALFGYNAPDWRVLSNEVRNRYKPGSETEWAGLTIQEIADSATNQIYLDAIYPQIVQQSWIVLSTPTYQEVYRVTAVANASRQRFTLTSKTTRIQVEGENLIAQFNTQIRSTVVFAQSERLELAEVPITASIDEDRLTLDQQLRDDDIPKAGQVISIMGNDATTNVSISQVVTLVRTELDDNFTRLIFTPALQQSYQRTSVTLNANVAKATHGETKQNVLGSGDGSQPFQTFQLKQSPLTYLSAATIAGASSTLELRVNDILWDEVETFYGCDRRQRIYTTQIAENGKVTVQFGDGKTGARLPSGTENIRATYRVGIGQAGMVQAGQLSLLMTRPLGVQTVTNPTAPTGAADPETRDEARQNSPVTVLTLGRIVSLQDFADFARAFAGIGKAQAIWVWEQGTRLVHVTIAASAKNASGNYRVPQDSDLYRNLRQSMDAARDAIQPLRIESYQPLTFRLTLGVKVGRRYVLDLVFATVTQQLQNYFSFNQRTFGQSVTESEILALVQAIDGIEAADLVLLYRTGQPARNNRRLDAQPAHWDAASNRVISAELLTLAIDGVTLTQME